MSGSEPGGARLVFVGGAAAAEPRTIGRLLNSHSECATVPVAARFHCSRGGLPDLLEGRVTLGSFVGRLRGEWWRSGAADERGGLSETLSEARFEAVVERFEEGYHSDPVAACARLFCELLGDLAAGKTHLVETSAGNAREAQTLRRLFPDCKLVHVVSDGRAAASSTGSSRSTSQAFGAIEAWAEALRSIEAGIRGEEDGATYTLPPERFTLIVLDDLIRGRREQRLGEFTAFLGVEPDAGMLACFEGEMSASAIPGDRWAQSLGRVGRARVRRRYERTLSSLQAEGNHAARPLIEAYERLG